jgi:hypothetical protein
VSVRLNPNGNPVSIGNVILRSPGLDGEATQHGSGTTGLRAAALTTSALEDVLAREQLEVQETVEITSAREVDAGGAAVRSTTLGEPAIEITVPDPGEAWGQLVLSTDESGVVTWHFARDENLAVDTVRGRSTRTYVIPRRVGVTPPTAETRGLIGALGKKLIKVLAFPLIQDGIGEVGDFFAARWEAANRPYGVRTFGPDDYRNDDGDSVDWKTLEEGRALLFVHGTFSRANSGFGALPHDHVKDLHRIYGGRVFAFNHFTLSDDPRQNVEWFINQLPSDSTLDLDIVSHSRGGIVARVFAEKQSEFSLGSRSFNVNKVVFVATPNAGTALADPDHMGDLIDSYTNILNFLPDFGVLDIFDGIVTVAKHIAVGALRGLEGLQSMNPRGEFLTRWLNVGPTNSTRYFALAADYEPAQPGLKTYARDILMDKIFGDENDLVVPTEGVFSDNGSEHFPIEDRHVFDRDAGIQHSNFFSNSAAMSKMLEWLGGP